MPWTTATSAPDTIEGFETLGIPAYIAAGRESHQRDWRTLLEGEPEPPPDDANHKTKMIYKLRIEVGKAIYKLRHAQWPSSNDVSPTDC